MAHTPTSLPFSFLVNTDRVYLQFRVWVPCLQTPQSVSSCVKIRCRTPGSTTPPFMQRSLENSCPNKKVNPEWIDACNMKWTWYPHIAVHLRGCRRHQFRVNEYAQFSLRSEGAPFRIFVLYLPLVAYNTPLRIATSSRCMASISIGLSFTISFNTCAFLAWRKFTSYQSLYFALTKQKERSLCPAENFLNEITTACFREYDVHFNKGECRIRNPACGNIFIGVYIIEVPAYDDRHSV